MPRLSRTCASREEREQQMRDCVEAYERLGSAKAAGRELQIAGHVVTKWVRRFHGEKGRGHERDFGLCRSLVLLIDMSDVPSYALAALANEVHDDITRDEWKKRIAERRS